VINIKKNMMVVIIGIIFVLILTIGILIHIKSSTNPQKIKSRYATILNDNYPTDILLLGENVDLTDDLKYRYSASIDEDVLKTAEGCDRQYIIISCYNGTFNPTVEQLSLLAEKLNNYQCDIYCLGNTLDAKLVEAGILERQQKDGYWLGFVYVRNESIYYGNGINCKNKDFLNPDDQASVISFLLEMMLSNLEDSLV